MMDSLNILDHNRSAWDEEVKRGNIWTIPVTRAELDLAVSGEVKILLTPHKPVPREWLGEIRGKDVLCLASGGGQQGPLLAAAGARVTVFDNSEAQLQRDREVAEAHHLQINTLQGNMQDLGAFADESFDCIIHPVSNCFVDDILPVWRECCRVLRAGGRLLSGFVNPLMYMIDWDVAEKTKRCELVHAIPYADTETLPPAVLEKYLREKIPFEFGHSLSHQIQGQIQAGFLIAGFYEDKGEELFDPFTDIFIATLAVKWGGV